MTGLALSHSFLGTRR